MPARRFRACLVPCLVLACIFFYARSFRNDLLRTFNGSSRFLAEDTLLAASDSVHEAMLSLFEAREDGWQTGFHRNAINHLDTKFKWLQASLDNLHRESLRRDIAPEEFSGPRSVKGRYNTDIHPADVCGSLAGKLITMIGGEHIYRLHMHLLQHMERAEGKPFPCPYHEFCTHHHICLPYQYFQDDAPPPRYIKPPTSRELIETESAVVNYIVSDTLLSTQDESSSEYNLPFVHPMTGVRLRETYWLAAARKANVVILGRGPLSAPGGTYTGNWSFLHHLPDYVDKSRTAIIGDHKGHDDEPMSQTAPRSLEILNAAVHLTVSCFLPDLFRLLQSIRLEVHPSRRKRLIWPSSWYRLPARGTARTALLCPHIVSSVQDMIQQPFSHHRPPRSSAEHSLMLQLSAFINTDASNTAHLEDPWTLLFNAQVYLENMVLREILPQYGIVFLPLDVLWVEDAQARGHGCGRSYGAVDTDVDLERTLTIGETFLTGIDYVLRYLE